MAVLSVPGGQADRGEKPPKTLSSWCRWWGRRFRLPTLDRAHGWQAEAPAPPFFHNVSVAVGMPVARHPPHRSVRALLTHTVLTSDVLTQSVPPDTDAGSRLPV